MKTFKIMYFFKRAKLQKQKSEEYLKDTIKVNNVITKMNNDIS